MQPYLIALFTSTAVPLVPNGQEFGEDHFVPEQDHNTGRRVISRPLRWKLATDPIGRTLTALHRRLAGLRRDHPALRSPLMWPDRSEPDPGRFNPVGAGVDLDRQLAVYHRWALLDDGRIENVVVVLNFSDGAQTLDVPFSRVGRWTDALAGFDGSGTSWDVTVTGASAPVTVDSHWGRVLLYEDLE
jgi:pullulanase/glycogen debranching enzyme